MILSPTSENLTKCAELILSDALIAVPTETVYGLAGNALSEKAASKIFEVKQRPMTDPLIIHCHDFEQACNYFEINQAIERLATALWPGPLTIVGIKKDIIPNIITSGQETIALRIPENPVFRKLIQLVNTPLAAPSANPFGYISPTEAIHVERTLGGKISAILDGGRSHHGLESTIIDLRDPENPSLLRHGPYGKKQIELFLDHTIRTVCKRSDASISQIAPGMLKKHYSPRAKVELFNSASTLEALLGKNIGSEKRAIVFIQTPHRRMQQSNTFWLSNNGSSEEIAHNLYSLLQKIDTSGFESIAIELAPNEGIGKAVNDRLMRAAAED